MPDTPASWWTDAVVYQLYVRSFCDANGDGRGDLAGIRARLGYLADLGVDAIWLNPCYPSPQYDHGYDVADFFDIEPDYGDLATFDAIVAEASALGLRVMMDIVPNHCSWEHPLFEAALVAAPGSPERERFWFRDGKGEHGDEPPNNWTSYFTGPAWSRVIDADGHPEQWYMHSFAPQQPDWNWTNAEVVDHYDRALRFWLDRGAAGFRVDAPQPVGKAPGLPDLADLPDDPTVFVPNPYREFRPEGHAVWQHWREVLDAYEAEHPGRDLVMVAETYSHKRPDIVAEFVGPNQHHQAFAFELMLSRWNRTALRDGIDSVVQSRIGKLSTLAWTMNNHDVQRSVTRLGRADAHLDPDDDGPQSLNQSDAPVDLAVGAARAGAALLLMLLLPGSSYIYQGEELGLPEVLDLPAEAREDPMFHRSHGAVLGRDGCRVPLPWTVDAASSYGFSLTTAPAAPWLPQPAAWGRYGADAQVGDPASTFALYQRVLRLRRKQRLAHGPFGWLDHPALLAYERGTTVVVTNPTGTTVALPAAWIDGRMLAASSAVGDHDASVVPADTTVWLTR